MANTLIVVTDNGTVYQVNLEEGKVEELPKDSTNAMAAASLVAQGVNCRKIDSSSAARGPLEIMGTFVNLPNIC